MSTEKDENIQPTAKPDLIIESDEDRLRRDIYRPDMKKFRLFTQMLRANALYKRAKTTHQTEQSSNDFIGENSSPLPIK